MTTAWSAAASACVSLSSQHPSRGRGTAPSPSGFLPLPWHGMARHACYGLSTCTLHRVRPALAPSVLLLRHADAALHSWRGSPWTCTGHWAASPSSRIYGSFAGVVDSACRAHRAFGRCNCKKRKTTTTTVVLVPGEREREAALPVEAGARKDRRANMPIVCDLWFGVKSTSFSN